MVNINMQKKLCYLPNKKFATKKVWNAFLGLMPSWTVGMAMGSSSPTMEYYSTDPSALEEGPLSQEEGSWFGKHVSHLSREFFFFQSFQKIRFYFQ